MSLANNLLGTSDEDLEACTRIEMVELRLKMPNGKAPENMGMTLGYSVSESESELELEDGVVDVSLAVGLDMLAYPIVKRYILLKCRLRLVVLINSIILLYSQSL